MSTCILCLGAIRQKRSTKLTELVSKDVTFEEAIRQQIRYNVLPQTTPSSQLQSCSTCYNAFKNFYKFLEKINTGLEAVNTEKIPENTNQIFIQPNELMLKVETPQIILPRIKVEPLVTDDRVVTEFNEIVDNVNENERKDDESDFEWGYDDPMDSIDDDSKSENEGIKTRSERSTVVNSKTTSKSQKSTLSTSKSAISKKKASKSTSIPDKPRIVEQNQENQSVNGPMTIIPSYTKGGYTRYLPRDKITQEMIDAGQKFVVIKGIEYKIPRPHKSNSVKRSKKSKKSRFIRSEDASRRKHPAHDPEGEERIKSFIDIKCYVCEMQFDNFMKLKRHFRLSHPNDKCYLKCCERKLRRRFEILDHIDVHDNAVEYKCKICNKMYKNKACLRTHTRYYHPADDAEKVICDECGKFFNNEQLLKSHLATHYSEESKILECYICKDSKTFKNLIILKNHLRSQHSLDKNNKMAVCEICSATVRKAYLQIHIKTVHGEQRDRIKCDICGFWMLETSIRAHMLKHNDMGINCKVCGKFLKSRYSISVHMKQSHSENHKFKCQYCDKRFFREIKMKEHVAVKHTREFLFKCRISGCDRQFRAEANWRIHEKKAHPEEYDKFFKPFYKRNPKELQEFEEMMESQDSC